MAKHTHRKLTSAELKRSRAARASVDADKDRLITVGQRIFAQHERLLLALKVLKAERERQGLSLSELACRTGISKGSLSRLENESRPNPTIDTLHRIAVALGKEVLITLTDRAA